MTTEQEILQTALQLIGRVREKHLTFCAGSQKLEHLLKALMFCRKNVPQGIYIEAGVAMGGSATVIAATKPQEAVLRLYDVYDMLPPPGEQDDEKSRMVYGQFLQGKVNDATSANYLQAVPDMLAFVKRNMQENGIDIAKNRVEFIKGLFEDTLRVNEPVAFCHIDCDWYESARCCIDRIKDHMAPNGLVVFDDYNSFDGCRKAVEEWLAADERYRMASKEWNVVIQRVA